MEKSTYNFMKMKLWNDLNNILILDTCAAGTFFKKIRDFARKNKKNKKSLLNHLLFKKTINLVNIENFREKFGNKEEGIINILKFLKEYIKIKFIQKDNISIKEWDYLEKENKEISRKYNEIDDHWIILKIKISFLKKIYFY